MGGRGHVADDGGGGDRPADGSNRSTQASKKNGLPLRSFRGFWATSASTLGATDLAPNRRVIIVIIIFITCDVEVSLFLFVSFCVCCLLWDFVLGLMGQEPKHG